MTARKEKESRRTVLASLGAIAATAVAGCVGGDQPSTETASESGAQSNGSPLASPSENGTAAESADVAYTGEPRVDGDWPVWRGDVRDTGFASGIGGPASTVEELWNVDLPGFIWPIVSHGTVFGNIAGTVFAFDAKTGSKQWQYDGNTDHGYTLSERDGVLYVGGGTVFALDRDTQEELWRSDVEGVDPIPGGNHLYVKKSGGGVRCLDAETGENKWSADIEGEPLRHVRSPEGGLFVLHAISGGPWDNKVQAFDSDGSRRWSYSLDTGRVWNGIAFGNGSLFVANGDSTKVSALDPASGEKRWSVDVSCNSAPAFDGEYLYTADLYGQVAKIDAAAGEVVEGWGGDVAEYGFGDPIVTEDRLYYLGYEKEADDAPRMIIAVGKETGNERWRKSVGPNPVGGYDGIPLAVTEDVVYSPYHDGMRAYAPERLLSE